MTSPVREPIPERLAEFEVVRRLGVGGMAEVFLAKKRGAEGTHKLLVLKRVLPQLYASSRFRSMFAAEAQLATRLNHPNIVQVYDFQEYADAGLLLSMEYVEGLDLRRLTRAAAEAGRALPPWVAAYIIAEVAKGLHYAHERRDERGEPLGIVHRDVSPQNILVSFDGAVKLADFGIATASLAREEPGTLGGKAGYMAPEQARGGPVDRRSDIFSLGAVFYELLAGRPIHGDARDEALFAAALEGRIEAPSLFARAVPPRLEELVLCALAVEPAGRFQTAREFAVELAHALFEQEAIIDAQALEQLVGEVCPRQALAPASREPPPERRDSLRALAGREVRHVALFSLRIHGLRELAERMGAGPARYVAQQLRGTLDEIAFKRQTRFAWTAELSATSAAEVLGPVQAIVGLMDHPARAPMDAARLALDVREALDAMAEELPVPLLPSMGLARGVATGRRDRTGHLVGHSVQETALRLAETLAAEAPPGGVWVAGGLYRLLRADFAWGDGPDLSVPSEAQPGGKPVRVHALERRFTHAEKLEHLAARQVVGRDTELADLHAAYHSMLGTPTGKAPRLGVRLLWGENGIGKTALASAFAAELPQEARVIRVECPPAQAELPFSNVGAWIRELTGVEPGDPPSEIEQKVVEMLGAEESGPAAQRLARLAAGRLLPAADESEHRHNRQVIAASLLAFLRRACAGGPLVVLVDSLQWSDRPSLEVLSRLVRVEDPLPVLVLLLTRPDERIAPHVQEFLRIELSGLGPSDQQRLLETRFNVRQGAREVVEFLRPRVGGNPYFLIEMVESLLERGVLELQDGGDAGSAGAGPTEGRLHIVDERHAAGAELPSTLEQLIADRLNELGPEERAVIDWLSVAEGELRVDELLALAGVEARAALGRLVARGLCEERRGNFDVRHPVTREVAAHALDADAARRMHRALGEHWAAQGGHVGIRAALVAGHLAAGGASAAAADYYVEAGHAAATSHQLDSAARHFRRAQRLAPPGSRSGLVALSQLEAIERQRGRHSERRRTLERLREAASASRSAYWASAALLATASFHKDTGRLRPAHAAALAAERAARLAEDPVLEVQAESLTTEILRDLGDSQGALAANDRALAAVRARSEEVPLRQQAEVWRTRGTLLRRIGRVHEAIDAHALAIALARSVDSKRLEARAKNSLAFALFVLGRFEDAIELGRESVRIDRGIGGRFQLPRTLSNIGQCYARLGDNERAFAYLRRACEAHDEFGDHDARPDTWLCSADVLIDLGDLETARELLGRAEACVAESRSVYDGVHSEIVRARLARSSGDAAAAVTHAYAARQGAEAHAYVSFHFYAMALEALARVESGEAHTGILLASTALGAIDAVQGSEFGVETRALCVEALARAGATQVEELRRRSRAYVERLAEWIREPALRASFLASAPVRALLSEGEPAA